MTAIPPDLIYRIVTDYEALQDGFADRIEDLNTTLTEVDAVGGLTRGNMEKLLRKPDASDYRPSGTRKHSRAFGWETLGKALKGTGLALALIIDDERFAPIKEQLGTRRKPMRSIVRRVRPRWLLTPQKASKLSKKRWASVPPETRRKMMKKIAKAGWIARRRRARKSVAVAPVQAQRETV